MQRERERRRQTFALKRISCNLSQDDTREKERARQLCQHQQVQITTQVEETEEEEEEEARAKALLILFSRILYACVLVCVYLSQ